MNFNVINIDDVDLIGLTVCSVVRSKHRHTAECHWLVTSSIYPGMSRKRKNNQTNYSTNNTYNIGEGHCK